MNNYLHFICGHYQLLLSADCILEVGENTGIDAKRNRGENATGKPIHALHRVWRERNLPIIDLAATLQLDPGRPHYQLVIYDFPDKNESFLTILDIDEIVGLVELEESEFVEFAEINQQIGQFFDKSYIHPDIETCLLRMNYPFPWLNKSKGSSE